MQPLPTIFLVLLVIGAVLWLTRSRRTQPTHDSVDRDMLEDAEKEVQGLSTFATPDDAEDELQDWGPGAPKP